MLRSSTIRLFSAKFLGNVWQNRIIHSKHTGKCTVENLAKSFRPKRIFSGIQPTGSIHLGNYFGAIRQWVMHQNQARKRDEVIFSIVDLHSLTSPNQDTKLLHENILEMTAALLACGLDPKKCIIFQQSAISQHAELSWVLGCLTTLARLGHLPQYKEKSATMKEIPLGLYIYPVLQSADILLYKSTHVPVGEDQLQHVQLSQHLARVFNHKFGYVFPRPTGLVADNSSSRLKSLRNPEKKMSKSDPDPKSRIDLTDDEANITEKCKKALTDFTSAVTFDPENRPAVANLITLHSLCTGLTPEQIVEQNTGKETAQYKLVVAEVVNRLVAPIRSELSALKKEPQYLVQVLNEGADAAREIAEQTWQEVKKVVGFASR